MPKEQMNPETRMDRIERVIEANARQIDPLGNHINQLDGRINSSRN